MKNFNLIPILVGDARTEDVELVLDELWNGNETLIVISSDLSHYFEYEAAQKIDLKTAHRILEFDYDAIDGEQACGYVGLRGLLKIAKKKGLRAKVIDLRNSGDTAGDRTAVVGYGAFHFYG